jgi:hypothetical protein
MYKDGKGVAQDCIQACMWLILSADSSEGENEEEAGKLLDEVTKKMTPQQIAEAQRLAKEWTPKAAD